jgi:hypothetical protein
LREQCAAVRWIIAPIYSDWLTSLNETTAATGRAIVHSQDRAKGLSARSGSYLSCNSRAPRRASGSMLRCAIG